MSDQTPKKEKYSEIVARDLARKQQEEIAKKLPGTPVRSIEEINRSVKNGTTRMSEAAMEILASEEAQQEIAEEEVLQDNQMLDMQNMHKLANILNRANSILSEGMKLDLDVVSLTHITTIQAEIRELAFQVLLQEHVLMGEMFNDQLTD